MGIGVEPKSPARSKKQRLGNFNVLERRLRGKQTCEANDCAKLVIGFFVRSLTRFRGAENGPARPTWIWNELSRTCLLTL